MYLWLLVGAQVVEFRVVLGMMMQYHDWNHLVFLIRCLCFCSEPREAGGCRMREGRRGVAGWVRVFVELPMCSSTANEC